MTAVAEQDTAEQSGAASAQALLAAIAGLLAALGALAAGELVAALVPGARSPVTSIGTVVIDLAPPALKDAAIETLGAADKPVLIGTVLAVLAVAALGAGVVAARRLWWGVTGVVVLGLVGPAAAWADPSATGPGAALPALAATAAGVTALWWLVSTLHDPTRLAGPTSTGMREPTGDQRVASDAGTGDATSRRAFLRAATTIGGVALGAGVIGRLIAARAESATAPATATLPASGGGSRRHPRVRLQRGGR